MVAEVLDRTRREDAVEARVGEAEVERVHLFDNQPGRIPGAGREPAGVMSISLGACSPHSPSYRSVATTRRTWFVSQKRVASAPAPTPSTSLVGPARRNRARPASSSRPPSTCGTRRQPERWARAVRPDWRTLRESARAGQRRRSPRARRACNSGRSGESRQACRETPESFRVLGAENVPVASETLVRALSRSGCLRTKRTIPRQCQSVRRVRKRRSVTACVRVRDDRLRDVPALPAGLARPGSRGRCPRRRGGSPRRSRRARRASRAAGGGTRASIQSACTGSVGSVLEQVVVDLARLRAEDRSQRRAPDDRAADRGEAAARGLPAAVGEEQLRADDARARMGLGELARQLDRVRPRLRVRVGDDDERSARRGDARVRVRGEAERPCSLTISVSRRPSGAGGFATTTSSSTCGRSASRQRSSSGSGPCVTTTPATLTGALGRPRACGAPSRPS